jgi:hypothetical protein
VLFNVRCVFSKILVTPLFCAFLCISIFTACQTPASQSDAPGKPPHSSVTADPDEDPAYAPVLKSWRRDADLYKDFLLSFSGTVVMMSPQMQEAYVQRLHDLQGEVAKKDENLTDPTMISVVVAFSVPVSKMQDLTESKIWGLTLTLPSGQMLAPKNVVPYKNKLALAAFFPPGNYWSKMFVIQFALPAGVDVQSLFAQQTNSVVFSMAAPEIKAYFTW